VAIDAVGSLLTDAVSAAGRGARVLVFGLNFEARSSVSPAEIASREIAIEGIYIANGTFPLALSLIAAHRETFRELITHRLPLEGFWDGVEAMRGGSALKVMLAPAGLATENTNHGHNQESTP
jgi:threonine dehydrogenase-like Zn-dependent dehydrogenase